MKSPPDSHFIFFESVQKSATSHFQLLNFFFPAIFLIPHTCCTKSSTYNNIKWHLFFFLAMFDLAAKKISNLTSLDDVIDRPRIIAKFFFWDTSYYLQCVSVFEKCFFSNHFHHSLQSTNWRTVIKTTNIRTGWAVVRWKLHNTYQHCMKLQLHIKQPLFMKIHSFFPLIHAPLQHQPSKTTKQQFLFFIITSSQPSPDEAGGRAGVIQFLSLCLNWISNKVLPPSHKKRKRKKQRKNDGSIDLAVLCLDSILDATTNDGVKNT